VRSDPEWIALYAIGGAAWLQLDFYLLSLFGIGAREDILERQIRVRVGSSMDIDWHGALLRRGKCRERAGSGSRVVLRRAFDSVPVWFLVLPRAHFSIDRSSYD